MSSKLIIPFNYQPFSVSVKTGAYTIPAGYYAYVTELLRLQQVEREVL